MERDGTLELSVYSLLPEDVTIVGLSCVPGPIGKAQIEPLDEPVAVRPGERVLLSSRSYNHLLCVDAEGRPLDEVQPYADIYIEYRFPGDNETRVAAGSYTVPLG
jgi:hypothetical protein